MDALELSAPKGSAVTMNRLKTLMALCGSLWASAATAQTAAPAEPSTAAKEEAKDTKEGASDTKALGLAPGTLQTANLVIGRSTQVGTGQSSSSEWELSLHGYLRAPMRIGFGKGSSDKFPDDVDHGMKVHSPPQIPDGTYTDWRFTNNLSGPWSEIHIAYGNDRASGHVIMGAYNFTEAGYRDLQAQLGISQAFVTLDFPRAFGTHGGLTWNVGAFMNSYGAAGRYDAGRYDTYLIGRTHVAGETMTAYFDVADDLRLSIEHGIGAKLGFPDLNTSPQPLPPYLPYPGPVQQGTTLLHHAHVGVTYKGMATLAAHYMTTWTDDAQDPGSKDGRVSIYGLDLKLIGGVFGDGYIGVSHVESREVMRLNQSLEFLHSYSGWSMVDNFFPGSKTGTGTIDSVLLQYTYSIASLLRYPEVFYGQGPDVVLGFFGSASMIGNDEKDATTGKPLKMPSAKLKFGGDVTYTMLSWLGASARYDLVQPDMKDDTQSFSVISPRLIVRTAFVTHEQVVLQYSRYMNAKRVTPSWPNSALDPDEDVVSISGSMWW